MPFDVDSLCNKLEGDIADGSLEQRHRKRRQPTTFKHPMIDSQSITCNTRSQSCSKPAAKKMKKRHGKPQEIKKLERKYLSNTTASGKKDLELLEYDEIKQQSEFLVDSDSMSDSSESDASIKINPGKVNKQQRKRKRIIDDDDSDDEVDPQKMTLKEMISDHSINSELLERQCPDLEASLASNHNAMLQDRESKKAARQGQARLHLVQQNNSTVVNNNNVLVTNQIESQVGTQVVNFTVHHHHHYHDGDSSDRNQSRVASGWPPRVRKDENQRLVVDRSRIQTLDALDVDIAKHPESSNPTNHQWISQLKDALRCKIQGSWPITRSKHFDRKLGSWAHRMRTKQQKEWKTSLLESIGFYAN